MTMLPEAPPKGAWIPDGCGLTLKECLWVMRVGPAERVRLERQGSPMLPIPERILNRLLDLIDPSWIGGRDQSSKIAFRGGGSDL